MFPDLNALLAPAVVARLTLLANHVLASEPQATRRLLPHQGRIVRLEFEGWPTWLPAPPSLAFAITPAGLVEWQPEAAGSDLRVRVRAGDPLAVGQALLAGDLPPLDIEGDARLATDVDWLAKNLRWDIAADLERVFGPMVAHQLQGLGSALARGLRAALARAGNLAGRHRAG